MIYLEEKYALSPATPAQLDALVALSQERLVNDYAAHGARLVAAWTSDAEQFHRTTHLYEMDDLEAFARFRERTASDADFQAGQQALDAIAPIRETRLLEAISPVWPALFRQAGERSQAAPRKAYTLAVLETLPGKLGDLTRGIMDGPGDYPIMISLKPITGPNNVLMDVWALDMYPNGYEPAEASMKDFFIKVRKSAPLERLEHVVTLPYSPLR